MDIVIWLGDNWIALLSVAIAIVSTSIAAVALRKSTKSNEYARRAEARETEVNTVDFDYEVDHDSGTLTLKNSGSGKTIDLQGTIKVENTIYQITPTDIDGEGRIVVTCSDIAQRYQDHLRKLRNAPNLQVREQISLYDYYSVGWNLSWHSPQRNPQTSGVLNVYNQFPDE